MTEPAPVSDHQPPESLCILRLSALGDVCNTVPVIRALQAAWPATRITWIIGHVEQRLVAALPGVEFVVLRKGPVRRNWTTLRRALDGRIFDVLLLAQVSVRANLLSTAIRARRRIGWDRARSREGHALFVREHIPAAPFQHQVQGLLSFARALGARADEPDWSLPIDAADRDFAAGHLPDPGRAVLISPCSSHPLRNWHANGYARVADWIAAETGRPVVLMGGPSALEREMGEAIARGMRQAPLNLIGKDTLGGALALIERGFAMISPDAGPAHFAAALGRPVVGLYAATWSRRSGPYGNLHFCIDRFPEAARRYRGREPERLRWGTRIEQPGVMALIDAEDVIQRVGTLPGL